MVAARSRFRTWLQLAAGVQLVGALLQLLGRLSPWKSLHNARVRRVSGFSFRRAWWSVSKLVRSSQTTMMAPLHASASVRRMVRFTRCLQVAACADAPLLTLFRQAKLLCRLRLSR